MKLVYIAKVHSEDSTFWVEFPDLAGCQSFADTLDDVLENAEEALSAYCIAALENGLKLPKPTAVENVKCAENEFIALIKLNLALNSHAVKKTLTIPQWLNTAAEEKNINFSQTLQEALKQKLNYV